MSNEEKLGKIKSSSHDHQPRTSSPTSSVLSASSDNSSSRNIVPAGMMNHLSDIRSLSPASSIASMQDLNTMSEKVKELESEKLALMIDHNNLIKEFNKRMESHLEEIRNLKDVNHNLEEEVTELRDLCCFLDDDRHKCRRLAKEWQRFGKHTVAVMRNEVMSYQDKLQSLDKKQVDLMRENGELRDLCVYLDNQRTNATSSSDSQSGLPFNLCKQCGVLNKDVDSDTNPYAYAAEQIKRLQSKVQQLEKEKESIHKLLMFGGKFNREKKRVSFSFPDDDCDSSSTTSDGDKIDHPPLFGNIDSYFKSGGDPNDVQNNAGILRNTNLSLPLKKPHTERSSNDITNDHMSDIRNRFYKNHISEGSSSELTPHELLLLKDISSKNAEQKTRADSNASTNSYDISSPSPVSPPPNTLEIPQYQNNSTNGEESEELSAKNEPPGYQETMTRKTSIGDKSHESSSLDS